MAKAPYLTQRVKDLIAEIYLHEPRIKSNQAREMLLTRMKAEGLDQNFEPGYPGLSSVTKQLKLCRERDEARTSRSKGQDGPWSLASLVEYPIPSEAIPAVMASYEKTLPDLMVSSFSKPLTIREALWVARLQRVVSQELLLDWAFLYALEERLSGIAGQDFDTYLLLDLILMQEPEKAKGAHDHGLWADELALELRRMKEANNNERKHKAANT